MSDVPRSPIRLTFDFEYRLDSELYCNRCDSHDYLVGHRYCGKCGTMLESATHGGIPWQSISYYVPETVDDWLRIVKGGVNEGISVDQAEDLERTSSRKCWCYICNVPTHWTTDTEMHTQDLDDEILAPMAKFYTIWHTLGGFTHSDEEWEILVEVPANSLREILCHFYKLEEKIVSNYRMGVAQRDKILRHISASTFTHLESASTISADVQNPWDIYCAQLNNAVLELVQDIRDHLAACIDECAREWQTPGPIIQDNMTEATEPLSQQELEQILARAIDEEIPVTDVTNTAVNKFVEYFGSRMTHHNEAVHDLGEVWLKIDPSLEWRELYDFSLVMQPLLVTSDSWLHYLRFRCIDMEETEKEDGNE